MFRTIYFNAAVVAIVEQFAQEHDITYNKAVNELIKQAKKENDDRTKRIAKF